MFPPAEALGVLEEPKKPVAFGSSPPEVLLLLEPLPVADAVPDALLVALILGGL